MRNSISAQSCASVPPEPAWNVRIAFLLSYSPVSSVVRRIVSISFVMASISACASGSSERSSASSPISTSASASSVRAQSFM